MHYVLSLSPAPGTREVEVRDKLTNGTHRGYRILVEDKQGAQVAEVMTARLKEKKDERSGTLLIEDQGSVAVTLEKYRAAEVWRLGFW